TRVSTFTALVGTPRTRGRRNVLTSTVPTGNVQASSEGATVSNPGTANHRSFSAPSDQKGTFTSYGTTPAAGTWRATSTNRPVAERVCGNGPAPAPPTTSFRRRPRGWSQT